MDTINNDLTNLLQQMGVHQESLGITQRIVMIAGAVYGLRDNIAPAASEQSDEAASDTGSKSVLGGQGHES